MPDWILFFVVVVGIPVVVTALVDVYRRHTRLKERQLELGHANAGDRARIDRLEGRIAVLERIATDPAERLDRQIGALRVPADH